MPIKLEIAGIEATIKRLESKASTIVRDVQDELNAFAEDVAKMAKTLAPGDEGNLRRSITAVPGNGSGSLSASVVVNAGYAAFIEFGTKKYAARYVATLPSDWKSYAATFKGQKGGSMDEFIQAIMAWVQRKGIGGQTTKSGNVSQSKSSHDAMQQAAYAIALNILQNGVKPQPFLYPAVLKYTQEPGGIKSKINAILDQ